MSSFRKKEFKKQDTYGDFPLYVLGVDVGGTNTNIAFAGVNHDKPVVLFSVQFKSQELISLDQALLQALEFAKQTYDINVSACCIGAAGVVSIDHNFAKLTNVSWDVDGKSISVSTGISAMYVINDFQAIGYGMSFIDYASQDDILIIKKASSQQYLTSTKVIVGAGTGLGKCVLFYDEQGNVYHPIASEGGHTDLPVYTEEEFEMMRFIQRKYRLSFPVTYEQVISGPGLMNIYEYLKQSGRYDEPSTVDIRSPEDISTHRMDDEICKKTFDLFTRFYARCIKNIILDTMALGGVYIAGGIAIKNQDLFRSSMFKEEVENAFKRNDVLNTVPLYLIHNYDLSLKGASYAALLRLRRTGVRIRYNKV